jgi:amino acid adenylation domain-containing protein
MPAALQSPRNLVEQLLTLASERGQQPWLTVVTEQDGEDSERVLSFGAFETRVRALAAMLQQRFAVGDRVLIMLDNDEHYAVAMLACFCAGVLAVPVFPPKSARAQHLERLLSIAADAQARGVLLCASLQAAIVTDADYLRGLLPVAVDVIDPALASAWSAWSPAASDVAFLQYTSGSTSTPKGVMVTHGNLMANLRAMQQMLDVGPADKGVTWQPLYHDMGLIGGLLLPLYTAMPLVLTSPEYFLERPSRWLELMTRFRATGSAGPDFAYQLCVDRIKPAQVAQLDLSHWRVALTGAEPIRAETIARFCEKFAPAGFDRRAMLACYGLAESTLLVTARRPGDGTSAQTFATESVSDGAPEAMSDVISAVGCGSVAADHSVAIVAASTLEPVAQGRIGEIWVSGPSISVGYWNNSPATDATFVTWRGIRWLRTGDRGFLRDQELYVTGRSKDLIVVRGHNIYPQDVEAAIEGAVPDVRKGRVAAFAVCAGEHREGIGVALEVARGTQKRTPPHVLVDALSAAVAAVFGEPLSVVMLLNPGALPRTSSGKLQRGACHKGWQDRGLDAYASFEYGRFVLGGTQQPALPLDATQTVLAAIWREVLHWDASQAVTAETHFFVSGGNSLAAVQAANRIAAEWDIEFPVQVLYESPRLGAVATEIERLCKLGVPRSQRAIAPLQQDATPALSHAQERQWFLWQLEPHGSAYHVNLGLRLQGPLEIDALRAALQDLVQRHASLRTVFRLDAAGQVVPQVQADAAVILDGIDLRLTSGDASEPLVQQAMRRCTSQPFDLTRGPLLRTTLLRLDEHIHLLVLTLHHIVGDGASMQVLIDELAQRYQAHCGVSMLPELPALPLQYADHAAWLRSWLAAGEGTRQLEYWRVQLRGGISDHHPVLLLPTDQPRRALASHRAACHEIELPRELSQGLQRCAASQGATLFMTLLTGFAALLYRYTGLGDLRIGVPVANRQRPECERIIGLFVNTLVMRVTPDGRMSLAQLLAQVRTAAIAAQAHQDLPFEQLVQALQPQRSLSRSALFQVMFNYLREDDRAVRQMGSLAISTVHVADSDAQFELVLDVRERADGTLRAVFTYAADLFAPSTIVRMAGHYQQWLQCLSTASDQTLGAVQYLSARELEQLPGGGPAQMPAVQPVHRLIEQQARARPQAVALVFEDVHILYAELNRWANRLARQLLRLGVLPEARVAVAVAPGPVRIVSLLACLKAGAAYVPLNTDHPASRLRDSIVDSEAVILITHSQLLPELLQQLPVSVQPLLLDDALLDVHDVPAGIADDPGVAVQPRHLAYLIYTSGTTGQPKAVAVEHGALSLHVQAMAAACEMTPADRLLQFAPVQVDAALEQSLVPLAAGAGLVLQRQWQSLAGELDEACSRAGVTVVDLPPAYARQLLRGATPFRTRLRLALLGGEAWSVEDLALIRRTLAPQQVINAYGPTEAVITPTLWRIVDQQAMTLTPGHVPIGRPLGQRRVYVLDQHLQPVPEGVPGELYLGGEGGLARGYLNRAGLTAERFVADPFTPGERLYRSGDLVRWRALGSHGLQLDYISRLDHQVKLHGLRIELGEVETCLRQQPEVHEALAVIFQKGGNAMLVAYVSLRPGVMLTGAELRLRLQQVLPDYLVPTAVMVLERLPLNAAGKVERSLLPAPVVPVHAGYQPPQGRVATTLADIWSEVLGVEQVGMHDNFFDLGGSSLTLIPLHRLLEARLHAGLTLMDLFKFPTVAALAQHIERSAAAMPEDSGESAPAADSAGQRAAAKRAAVRQRQAQVQSRTQR